MSDIDAQVRAVFRSILTDIGVELGDEFDQNFERQGFFSEKWARRKSPTRPGGLTLVATSELRRSIKRRTTENSITFYSDLPYAEIHNEGGEIKVTERMKRFFRYKFYDAQGGFDRKSSGRPKRELTDGGFYAWTSKMSLNTEAEFWRAMALMKVGSTIKIPQRKFLGKSPEVEAAVRKIVEDNLNEYINNIDFNIK